MSHVDNSHATAAQLYGVPLPRRHESVLLHVGTPHARRPVDAVGVIGHRMRLRDEDYSKVIRMPVSGPERTWLDLASLLTLRELVAAGDFLVRRGAPLTTIDVLRDAFARYPGRPGRPLIRAALPLLDAGAESPRESWLRIMLIEAGFPAFETNQNIVDENGNFVARVDLVSRRHRIVVEYEGDHHRSDPVQWQRDVARARERHR